MNSDVSQGLCCGKACQFPSVRRGANAIAGHDIRPGDVEYLIAVEKQSLERRRVRQQQEILAAFDKGGRVATSSRVRLLNWPGRSRVAICNSDPKTIAGWLFNISVGVTSYSVHTPDGTVRAVTQPIIARAGASAPRRPFERRTRCDSSRWQRTSAPCRFRAAPHEADRERDS